MSSSKVRGSKRPTRTASGRSEIVYWPRPLNITQRIARALAMCATEQVRAIVDDSSVKKGRPRKLPLPVVMAILYLHAISSPSLMTIPAMIRTVDDLSEAQRQELGIPNGVALTYKRLYSGVTALRVRAGGGIRVGHDHDLHVHSATGELRPCPDTCPAMELTPEDVATTLIQASLTQGLPRTPCIAVDGTDMESSAVALRHTFVDESGHEWFCVDPDARKGKRTPTERRQDPFYVGYEGHLATAVPPVNGASIPQVCIGLSLRPGVTDRADAAVRLIQAIRRWQKVDEALFDRGYTTATPENFSRPLRALGVSVIQDLHTNQRGVSAGPIPHTIWIDGALYCDALPRGLWDLEPPTISMNTAERTTIREAFDAREPYRFTVHSSRDTVLGTQRFKGPALAGHLRCPNSPASMRMSTRVPTAACTPGKDCGCGKTVTVLDTDHERDRQRLPWQSTAWARSYARQSLAEGLNAQIRYQNLNVNRGFIRMLGYRVTNLLLAITLAGRNVCRLYAWYTTRGLPEPWQEELGEPVDDRPLDRYTRTRGQRLRGPPKRARATTDN